MSQHVTSDYLGLDRPLMLDCGDKLSGFQIAYTTYGDLNEHRDNAILVCHALTCDQYVASQNPETGKEGWWTSMVGPDRPIDTNRYYVICSNVIGGCMGSTGPSTIHPDNHGRWGVDFPFITIADMVRAQEFLLNYLEIEKLYAVVGGSMGGMQALEWLRLFPERIKSAIIMASSDRQNALNIALHEVGRHAILTDPDWCNGAYYDNNSFPAKGLAVARLITNITYLSKERLNDRIGRQRYPLNLRSYALEPDSQVESYLNHQGTTFTERFDPNSYLCLTKAVDYFHQAEESGDDLKQLYRESFGSNKPAICLVSMESDWLYPPEESIRIENAMRHCGVSIRHITINSNDAPYGHDSFLISNDKIEGEVRFFLSQIVPHH